MELAEKRKIVSQKIVEKAIELLETALKGEKEAFELRDLLFNMYKCDKPCIFRGRGYLSLDFLNAYRSLYLPNLRGVIRDQAKAFEFLFMVIGRALEVDISAGMMHKYFDLQNKMFNWSSTHDQDPNYSWFYELIYSTSNPDLLYYSGLLLTKEELGVEL